MWRSDEPPRPLHRLRCANFCLARAEAAFPTPAVANLTSQTQGLYHYCLDYNSFSSERNCGCTHRQQALSLETFFDPQLDSLESSSNINSSNEASPPTRPQEMESSGAGALAAQAAPLQSHSHTPDPFARMTLAEMDFSNDDFLFGRAQPLGSLETPVHASRVNSFQASNLRESGEEPRASPTSADAATVANILANTNNGLVAGSWDNELPSLLPTGDSSGYDQDDTALVDQILTANDRYSNQAEWQQDPVVLEEPKDVRAYAKLAFADGDYYITTFDVILGRDMDFWKQQVREAKQMRRAEQAVEVYRMEPSQPSQPDDGDGDGDNNQGPSSKDSQSLEGRPAKALPSNFSEQGGAVFYAADEDPDVRRVKRKRRLLASKSSSTTSVVPASLHPSMMGDFTHPNPFSTEAGAINNQPTQAFVPIHPSNPADIRAISKEHLLFSYNFEEEAWEVKVLGNHAYINDERHQRGDVVPLSHHDRINVTSLSVEFKLPDAGNGSPGPSRGTFGSDGEDEEDEDEQETPLRTSPSRRLSNAVAVGDSDEEGEEVDAKAPRKKSGFKITLGKKRKAQKEEEEEEPLAKVVKKQKRKESMQDSPEEPLAKAAKKPKRKESMEHSPEVAKNPEKGKKPKTAAKEPAKAPKEDADVADVTDLTGPEEAKEEKVSPPAQPINLEPGSIFEGVAPEHLPQKRKGPGRPPKNGLISKRDQSFVKRKQKEYEKRGIQPPPFDQLVAEVRAETKQKEAAAKAAARGEAPPEMPILQSIENDPTMMPAKLETMPSANMDLTQSATPMEPVRKPSPKPKRIVKSPSPMKPEAEYTEEEMKKPTMTYVHILDEVLRDHPIGKADLQELYDRICKRYPYFKFKTGTSGWQSSVRHNLLQHERFKEDGRSGKGRLWAINYDHPLEKEKKRNRTPPPRPYPQMQNGNFPPMPPYGAPNYNGAYGQPGVNGQPQSNTGPQPGSGNYYSPYAPRPGQQQGPYGPPPGQHGAPPMPHNGQQHGAMAGRPPQQGSYPPYGQPNHAGMPPNQNQHTPPVGQPHQPPPGAPPAAAPPFGGIVEEIMAFRTHWLSRFTTDSPAFNEHTEMFRKVTNFHSEQYHGTSTEQKPEMTEAERRLYDDLEQIFARYRPAASEPPKSAAQESDGKQEVQVVAGPSGSGGGGVGQAVSDAAERSDPAGTGSGPASVQAAAPGAPSQVRTPGAAVAPGTSAQAALPAGQQPMPPAGQQSMATAGQQPMATAGQQSMAPAGQQSMAPAGQQSIPPPAPVQSHGSAVEQAVAAVPPSVQASASALASPDGQSVQKADDGASSLEAIAQFNQGVAVAGSSSGMKTTESADRTGNLQKGS